MSSKNFSIAPTVVSAFPEVEVAAIRVSIPDTKVLEPLISDLQNEASKVTTELAEVDPITKLPQIVAWRDTYRSMGVKASKFHSSIEALLRRVKKGNDLSTGLRIVDFYNLISVTQRAPIGAYDAKKLSDAGVHLRKANPGTDTFDPLGGSADSFPLTSDLVVYGSEDNVLCWGFNTRDASSVCVDETTTDVLFFSEVATSELQKPQVPLEEISRLLKQNEIVVGPVHIFNGSNSSGVI